MASDKYKELNRFHATQNAKLNSIMDFSFRNTSFTHPQWYVSLEGINLKFSRLDVKSEKAELMFISRHDNSLKMII
jgi:hypothetical protein